MDTVAPRLDQPLQPHAEAAFTDFGGIGRADGGDRIGGGQAGLQKADAAIIFDAVDRVGHVGQAEVGEHLRTELTLEGDVVDGHHARGAVIGVKEAEIGGRHRRLPVVRVEQIEVIARNHARRDLGRGIAESGEALPVVFLPVQAAGAREQFRRVEDEQRMLAKPCRE